MSSKEEKPSAEPRKPPEDESWLVTVDLKSGKEERGPKGRQTRSQHKQSSSDE